MVERAEKAFVFRELKEVKALPYYRTCLECNSNLDPGESCDCKKNKKGEIANTLKPKNMESQFSAVSVIAGVNEQNLLIE